MYDDEVFADRFRYQLTTFEIPVFAKQSRLLHAHIAYEIAFAKITAEICRIFHSLARFNAVEFNRLTFPTDNMYDDEVFVDPFRYQFTMFLIRVWVRLSRYLHAHNAYEIAIADITAEFLRNSYRLA